MPSRASARAALGLAPDVRAVLVVAGSWGVGEVVDTVRTIGRTGEYHPITVCGKDADLKAKLDELGIGTVIGWTSEMPSLMAAADTLVENAGGLTAMEAFASGLPVITFNAIPGRGRDNGARMEAAGVSIYARTDADLAPALKVATTPGPDRELLITNARGLFAGDAAEDVLALAESREPVQVAFGVPKGPRRLVGTAASLIILYGGLTIGAQAVAAMGVGVARAPVDATGTVYTGVRLNEAELEDKGVTEQIAQLHATAVVNGIVAQQNPVAVGKLAALGVDIGNGGWGKGRRMRWSRASNDVKHAGLGHQRRRRHLDRARVRPAPPGRRLRPRVLPHVAPEGRRRRPRGAQGDQGVRPARSQGRRDRRQGPYDPRAPGRAAQVRAPARRPRARRVAVQRPAMNRRLWALGATAAGAGVVLGLRHALPSVTSVSFVRMRVTPSIAGVGSPDHTAITFDDGPDPRRPRRSSTRSTRSGGRPRSSCSAR